AEHVRELRRYCEQVVLVMDGDTAGQKAADRAVQVFLTGNLDVSIAVLPGGQDPDELVKAGDSGGGLKAWERVIASAEDALVFAFGRVQANLDDAGTITGRQRVAEDFMNQLVELGVAQTGGVRRAFVVARLAEMLHMSEAAIDQALKARTPRSSRNSYQSEAQSEPSADIVGPDSIGDAENNPPDGLAIGHSRHRLQAVGKAERRFVAALVRHNNLFHATLPDGTAVDEAVSPAELAHPEHRRLYERVYAALSEGQPIDLRGLCGDLAIDGQHDLIQLATTADAELDRLLPAPGNDPEVADTQEPPASDYEPVKATLLDAVQTITQYLKETHTQQLKRDLMRPAVDAPPGSPTDPDDATRQAELLRRYVESRKANPSPGRIARL
ncbi:MAG: toprim domain-containing protein, partial [Planctomycetota bacterium]